MTAGAAPESDVKRSRAGRASLLALSAILLVSAVSYMPFCALAHRCGCSWPWARADGLCNVHAAFGPHCPWCAHRALGALAALGIGGGQALVFRLLRRRGVPVAGSALGAAAAFVVIAPLVATVLWMPTDYPHLFGRDARARMGLPPGPVRCHGTGAPSSLNPPGGGGTLDP